MADRGFGEICAMCCGLVQTLRHFYWREEEGRRQWEVIHKLISAEQRPTASERTTEKKSAMHRCTQRQRGRADGKKGRCVKSNS